MKREANVSVRMKSTNNSEYKQNPLLVQGRGKIDFLREKETWSKAKEEVSFRVKEKENESENLEETWSKSG